MRTHISRLCLIGLLGLALVSGSVSRVSGEPAPPTPSPQVYLPLIQKPEPPAWIGPGGGRILCLAIDPQNTQNWYAGTVDAGLFKSTDAGATWVESNTGLGGTFIQSLAVSASSPNILYTAIYKDKLYKSTDSGATWTAVMNGIQSSPVIYAIAIDPTHANKVYIGTRGVSQNSSSPDGKDWNGVLYASTDGGASWTARLKDIGGSNWGDWIYSISIAPKATSTLFATSHEHGPYLSTDAGQTWKQKVNDLSYSDSEQTGRAIVVDPNTINPATVYYGTWKKGLFKSTDSANNWSPINSGVGNIPVYPGSLAIDPSHPSNLYVGSFNGGIYKSTNQGSSWASMGLTNNPIYSVLVSPKSSQTVLAGTQTDGLYKSSNGGASWAHWQNGLHAGQVTSLIVAPQDPNILYASTNGSGVFVSTDHGTTWRDYNTNLPDKIIYQLVVNPNMLVNSNGASVLFALTYSSGLYSSDTSGNASWTRVNNSGLPSAASSTSQIEGQAHTTPNETYPTGSPFDRLDVESALNPDDPSGSSTGVYPPDSPFNRVDADSALTPDEQAKGSAALSSATSTSAAELMMQFAPSDSSYAYLGVEGQGVYKSTDGGLTWAKTKFTSTTSALAVDPTQAQVVYVAKSGSSTISVTQNGGVSWSTAANLTGASIYALTFSQVDQTTLYAATSAGLYRRDGSGTWSLVGLSGKTVTAVAPDPVIAGRIYAGTTAGAYESVNGGQNWFSVASELNSLTIQTIYFDEQDPDHIYFATTTHDILRVAR